MADTTFTDRQTPIVASWLNDVNDLTYNIGGTGSGQGASRIGNTPSSGGTTGVQAATVAINLNSRTRSILDFIPNAKHSGIRDRTNTDDLTTYFQNATIAVNGDVIGGAGKGGKVLVPAGRYRLNKVGCRDTYFEGEGFKASLIEAFSVGSGTLLDTALDRDGATANTDGGQGGFRGFKLDGRSLGYSGVRVYGGFSPLNDLWITGCIDGLNIGLPIGMHVSRVYIAGNSGKGFHTYSGAGDQATSLDVCGVWCDTNGTYNYHIEQLTYSTFRACSSQGIPATGRGWFAEGNTNGSGVGVSLAFDNCGSEGDLGEPFYFKAQRGLIVRSPRIVSPPLNKNLVTFDNTSGSLEAFQSPAPGGGFFGLSVANFGDSAGAIVAIGGDFSVDPTQVNLLTVVGASVNSARFPMTAGSLLGQIESPSGLAATTNDYAGLTAACGTARVTTFNPTATITGMAGGRSGREIHIFNYSSANSVIFTHEGAGSVAANRFNLPSSASITLTPFTGCVFVYDAALSRWIKK